MKTLILHPGALGDVLLSLKAVRGLRRSFPHAIVIWVGKDDIGDLLRASGEVNHTIALEGRFFSELFLKHEHWSTETHNTLADCTHLVGWLSDPDKALEQNLQSYGLRSVIIQSPHDPGLFSKHYENRYLETLGPWLIKSENFSRDKPERISKIDLSIQGLLSDPQSHRNRRRIVIHPGSGSLHKCTTASFFATVIARLLCADDSRELIILEGPADQKYVHDLCSALPSHKLKVLRNQSLSALAQFFSVVDLFIGHDSGLTHLSVACGVRSIVLFGPTDPEQWAPRGSHVTIMQGDDCQCQDWKSVQGCESKTCLNISAEKVIEQAEYCLRMSSTVEHSGHQALQRA